MEIAEFTHSVETLLDEMRNGVRAVSPDAVQVLLQSVDVIREMTQSAQAKQPIVTVGADALSGELARILAQKGVVAAAVPASPALTAPPAARADGGQARAAGSDHRRTNEHLGMAHQVRPGPDPVQDLQ
jgi:two-component system chemotaxis sensor kinase CheA